MMTAAVDTLYLPVPVLPKIRAYDGGLQEHRRTSRSKPQLQEQHRPRFYRLPSTHHMKGMTYGPDGRVGGEWISGKLIDIYA